MISEKVIVNHQNSNINISFIEGGHYVKIKGPFNEVNCKITDLVKILDKVVEEKNKLSKQEDLKVPCKNLEVAHEPEPSFIKRKITNRVLGRKENDVQSKIEDANRKTKELTKLLEGALQRVDESTRSNLKYYIKYANTIMEGLEPAYEIFEEYNQVLRDCLNKSLSNKKIEAIQTIFDAAVKSGAQDSKALRATIEDELFKLNNQNKTHSFEINDKLYVVSKMTTQNYSKIIQIAQRANKFAQGGYGDVFDVEYLGSLPKRNDIMKIAKDKEKARKDLLNEKRVLNYIHKKGKKIGIQDSPHTVIQYNLKGNSIVGYIAPKYKMDGFKLVFKSNELTFIDLSTKEILTGNLMKGLESIHSLNLYHGDIKLENMLYREGELVISDFGGVRNFSKFISLDSFPSLIEIFGSVTPSCMSINIIKKAELVLRKNKTEYDLSTSPEDKKNILKSMLEKEIAPLLRKNDQFALGLALYAFWVSELSPFKSDKISKCAIVTKNSLGNAYDELEASIPNKKIRKAIYELLWQGLAIPDDSMQMRQNLKEHKRRDFYIAAAIAAQGNLGL